MAKIIYEKDLREYFSMKSTIVLNLVLEYCGRNGITSARKAEYMVGHVWNETIVTDDTLKSAWESAESSFPDTEDSEETSEE